MDQLEAFGHWKNRQALDKAVLVAAAHDVDLEEIRRWSAAEGHDPHYLEFRDALKRATGRPVK